MENEPKDPLPFKSIEPIYKWWHPLIPLAILFSGRLLTGTIFYYYLDMGEDSIIISLNFLFIFPSFVILFAAFIHFLRAKRWRDFRLLFLASIILVCGYLFLTLVIDLAHYT
jgi:hypothetical protein